MQVRPGEGSIQPHTPPIRNSKLISPAVASSKPPFFQQPTCQTSTLQKRQTERKGGAETGTSVQVFRKICNQQKAQNGVGEEGGLNCTKSHLNYYCKILRRPFSQFCTAGLTEPSRKLTIALVAGGGDGGSKVPKSRFAVLTALPHEGNRIPVPR